MNSALIVVDMLNTYEHEDADTLTESVREALPSIEALIERARREYLLRQQEIERIVLAGQVTEQCILYSALDGYVRHFAVGVPRDAVAAIHADLAAAALQMMERNMRADVSDSEACEL